IAVQSSGMRFTSAESPECGPEPVTSVPTTMSTSVAITRAQLRPRVPGTVGTGVAGTVSCTRCQVRVVVVSKAIASTKCIATIQGLSPASTVNPPATAFATTSQNCDQASRVSERCRGFCNLAAMITQATGTAMKAL